MLVNLPTNLDINMSMCISSEKLGQSNTAYEVRLTGSFCSGMVFKDFEIFCRQMRLRNRSFVINLYLLLVTLLLLKLNCLGTHLKDSLALAFK